MARCARDPSDRLFARAVAPRRRIGILGGSFAPAHSGHVLISKLACKYLALDELWWVVAYHHPFKDHSPRDYASRLRQAKNVASAFPMIRISSLEAHIKSRSTYALITALQSRRPRQRYILIVGADVLAELPRWHRWQDVVQKIPLAIFDRQPYTYKALLGQFAQRYRRYRTSSMCSHLVSVAPPAWIFFNAFPRSHLSSSELRGQSRPTTLA
ncbi:MAG: nicotinic acid mononucleotide adenylyltransferase [Alphaproteobacteria bacterium GM202ARS2]|nr:nicotinic acid mononucleotide adenylyltransferase [Alphaproteobacteria bacterium GM202ARS2]